jgi:hypothetical protein
MPKQIKKATGTVRLQQMRHCQTSLRQKQQLSVPGRGLAGCVVREWKHQKRYSIRRQETRSRSPGTRFEGFPAITARSPNAFAKRSASTMPCKPSYERSY